MIRKIAITGPESTGKSTLAQQLATYYNTVFVPEYARTYIAQLQRQYTLEDILHIAKGQVQQEKELINSANQYLFADTELLVTKIWATHAFGQCPEWIEKSYQQQHYDLYLLMNIDLPWQPDPQREHPHQRDFFFEWYQKELSEKKAPFVIISGSEKERLQNAVEAIDFFK